MVALDLDTGGAATAAPANIILSIVIKLVFIHRPYKTNIIAATVVPVFVERVLVNGNTLLIPNLWISKRQKLLENPLWRRGVYGEIFWVLERISGLLWRVC